MGEFKTWASLRRGRVLGVVQFGRGQVLNVGEFWCGRIWTWASLRSGRVLGVGEF